MSRAVKTIQVNVLRCKVNEQLSMPDSKINTIESRRAIANLLETVLHETGNYRGFNYNAWIDGGFDQWKQDGEPDFPEKYKYLGDQSKVHYF